MDNTKPDDVRSPVDVTVDTWRSSLAARAGASALEDLSVLGDSYLDLSTAHPSGMAQLFAGRTTLLANLVRDPDMLAGARRRVRLLIEAVEAERQRGGAGQPNFVIGVVHGASTEATANAADATTSATDAVVSQPVLLRPITITQRGDEEWELELEPHMAVNPVFEAELIAAGVTLDGPELAAGAFANGGFDPRGALAQLRSLTAAAFPSARIDDHLFIGTFADPAQSLAADFETIDLSHEVIQAMAGEPDAIASVGAPLPEMTLGDRDFVTERGVGDLGVVERHVLDVVGAGHHLYVQVPTGSDAAGVAAALVADAAAAGRTVVYVSGHHRVTETMLARLDGLGLDDLYLTVDPQATWRSTIARRLFAALSLEQHPLDVTRIERVQEALKVRRNQLADYVAGLHERRERWDASAYDALHALSRLTAVRGGPTTTVRLDPEVAAGLTADRRAEAAAELTRAALLGAFSVRPTQTPWYNATLATAEATHRAFETASRLVVDGLPRLRERIVDVAEQTGLNPAKTVAEWASQLDMIAGIRTTLDVFTPEVFERSVEDMVIATATRAWRSEHSVQMSGRERRRLERVARELVRPGRPVDDLHAALSDVSAQRRKWQAEAGPGTWPKLPTGLAQAEREYEALRTDLATLEAALVTTPAGGNLAETKLDDLEIRLSRLVADEDALAHLPERNALLGVLRRRGLGDLLDDLQARHVPAPLVADELNLAWWTTAFEQILSEDPALAGYDGATLATIARQFRDLDRYHVNSRAAALRADVVAAIAERLSAAPESGQDLFTDLGDNRLRSYREAVTRYPDLVRYLRPVLVCPPAAVAGLLPPSRTEDLVVFDAAETIPVDLALAAIARGQQIVALGGLHPRPGTAAEALSAVLPQVTLPTQPATRDPYLSAFLADHGLGERTYVGPQSHAQPLLTFDVVIGTGTPNPATGLVDSSDEEVQHVLGLIIDHALTQPGDSLGVVTISDVHATQIRNAVTEAVRENPALTQFFDPASAEPFVVTALTDVAGLQRDRIVFTLGLAKTPHGRLLHRFGPVGEPGGDGLLLTALAATRHQLAVVTSFTADELDVERLRPGGPVLLHAFLTFAQLRAQGATIAAGDTVPRRPDRMMLDLGARLEARGLRVEVDYGITGSPRIPLAVGYPDEPELLVAVITDDAAYVAEPAVRVRDRLVAQSLERLGWTVVQVWSAAVFLDPEAEADAIVQVAHELYERLLAQRPAVVPVPPSQPEPVEEEPDDIVIAEASVEVMLAGEADPEKLAEQAGPVEQESPAGQEVPVEQESLTEQDGLAEQESSAEGVADQEGPAEDKTEEIAEQVIPPEQETPAEQIIPPRPRPDIEPGLPITSYGASQIDALAQWIVRTGEWTEETLLNALRTELGLTRRGAREDAVLRASVRRILGPDASDATDTSDASDATDA